MLPVNRALEIEYCIEFLSAERCLELGLANRVVPHAELLDAANEAAEKIKKNSSASLRHIKEATIRGLELPIDERLRVAQELNRRCLQTEDAREGLRAFVEKPSPSWTGS